PAAGSRMRRAGGVRGLHDAPPRYGGLTVARAPDALRPPSRGERPRGPVRARDLDRDEAPPPPRRHGRRAPPHGSPASLPRPTRGPLGDRADRGAGGRPPPDRTVLKIFLAEVKHWARSSGRPARATAKGSHALGTPPR